MNLQKKWKFFLSVLFSTMKQNLSELKWGKKNFFSSEINSNARVTLCPCTFIGQGQLQNVSQTSPHYVS